MNFGRLTSQRCPHCDPEHWLGIGTHDEFMNFSHNLSLDDRSFNVPPPHFDRQSRAPDQEHDTHDPHHQEACQVANEARAQIDAEIEDHLLEYMDRRIRQLCEHLGEEQRNRERLEYEFVRTEAALNELSHRARLQEFYTRRSARWEGNSSTELHNFQLLRHQGELTDEMVRLQNEVQEARGSENRIRHEIHELRLRSLRARTRSNDRQHASSEGAY